jgi:transposase
LSTLKQGFRQKSPKSHGKRRTRLHKRYMKLLAAGKDERKTTTAIGRELLGFIWAIGIKAVAACKQQVAA